MDNNFYVYFHKRPDGSIFYVGKGKDKRAYSHQNRNKYWHNIVNKHKKFSVEIYADNLNEEEALRIEAEKITEIGLDNLCNIVEGGGGISGLVHTEDTRNRMSVSHKKRYEENPDEMQRLLGILEGIHQRVREDPEKRKAISERVKNWWESLPEEDLESISKIRSENAKKMWEDEGKKKELSEAIKKSHANMSQETKLIRAQKLSEGNAEYNKNMTEEQRKIKSENANKYLRSPEAVKKYKEARCRKLVLNRSFIVESRIELARLLKLGQLNIDSLEDSKYQIKSGFFIEDYDPELHKTAVETVSLDNISRIYPISGNSVPVKNSNGDIFLSVKEAADSLSSSKANDQTKYGSIYESCKFGNKAYGLYWSKPSEEEVTKEIFERLDRFLEGRKHE